MSYVVTEVAAILLRLAGKLNKSAVSELVELLKAPEVGLDMIRKIIEKLIDCELVFRESTKKV